MVDDMDVSIINKYREYFYNTTQEVGINFNLKGNVGIDELGRDIGSRS